MTMQQPFDSAVREHGPTVLRVCRAVLGSGADAEEAWSETFLSALRAWPELDPLTNVEAWLVRIARRRCVDVIRARSRRADPVGELPRGTAERGLPSQIGGGAPAEP
ncbi:RNA polymerase sigma factor, partial [Dietzia sp.]|uniref:RNA polymerase sigma factor n=1 Tax=Dietzia sp. TaxID=1871616 RepID=UPI002FDAFDB0